MIFFFFFFIICLSIVLLPLSVDAGTISLAGTFNAVDVEAEAGIALDAAAMKETDDLDEKKRLYRSGRDQNSDGSNNLSLANLSLQSYPLMAEDALYNIYRYSFYIVGNTYEGEDPGMFDNKPVQVYADTIVQDLFDIDSENTETEAALIMSVWMMVVHNLYEAMRTCQNGDETTAVLAVDRAAAFWIGDGQISGDNDSGHLLYNLAETAGERFEQDNGQTLVNTNFINALNLMKNNIIQAGKCGDDAAYLDFRNTVDDTIGLMTIPLVQNLIHYMEEQKPQKLELYALALVPLIGSCDEAAYEFFLNELVLSNYKAERFDAIVSRLQSMYSCLHVTCADIGTYRGGRVPACSDDPPNPPTKLVGYSPLNDVRAYSYVDRDIRQMEIMLEMDAFEAALDHYMYGHNMRLLTDGEILTLQNFATSNELSNQNFLLFKEYYNSANYADNMILDAFNKGPPFENASNGQLKQVIIRTIQVIVMYMYPLQSLYNSVEECNVNDKESATKSWDNAVALLVGSMEGPDFVGGYFGRMMYSISSELCEDFSTCEDNDGNSEANRELLEFLTNGKGNIQNNQCSDASGLIQNFINPLLIETLVQGTLHYVFLSEDLPITSRSQDLADAHVFSRSILPFITDTTNSKIIQDNMVFQLKSAHVPNGARSVFVAMAQSLDDMGIACADVGIYIDSDDDDFGNLCSLESEKTSSSPTTLPNPPSPPSTSNSEELGFGRYEVTTDVSEFASFAYDVRDMKLLEDDAADIYNNGKYSDFRGSTLSLFEISSEAEKRLGEDEKYNIYRYAFEDEAVFVEEDGSDTFADSSFANTVVQYAFEIAEDNELAADAAVLLDIWMEITHELRNMVAFCEESDAEEAVRAVDVSVAYWIGYGQTEGTSNGYLLYSIAEKAGSNFGQGGGESDVNKKIIDLFNEAKTLANTCSDNSNAASKLRRLEDKIISQMNIPLIQQLIHFLSLYNDPNDADVGNSIQLYTIALIPQVVGCRPSDFDFLKDKLIDEDIDVNNFDAIFRILERSLDCFGVTCLDLGTIPDLGGLLKDENFCGSNDDDDDDDDSLPLAGYQPASDPHEFAKIDRDILQIRIMMEMDANIAAKDIYMKGRNSLKGSNLHRSLQDLSTSRASVVDDSGNTLNTEFQRFSGYFGGASYADTFIMGAFDGASPFDAASKEQIIAVVMTTLQTSVSFMHSINEFYAAVSDCQAGNYEKGIESWDKGVATLIGSIEGTERGGSVDGDGVLLYELAKQMCPLFGTCAGSDDALSNEVLIGDLLEGQSKLATRQCSAVLDVVKDKILPIIQIPLVQGTLNYASENDGKASTSQEASIGAGFALSRAILPQVDAAKKASARIISENMKFIQTPSYVHNGANAVFDAFSEALDGMGIACADVGVFVMTPTRGVCKTGKEGNVTPPSTPTVIANGLYTTTTYVEDRLKIAHDVRDIEKALKSGNKNLAIEIYSNGLNSDIFDSNGLKVGQRSLKSFSVTETQEMQQEPTFNFFRYALGDSDGAFRLRSVDEYADVISTTAFDNTKDPTIASEAVIALNLWMYVTHELYQTLDNCKNKRLADDDGIHSIDEAVAYWIGDSQQAGSGEQGHVLYALAERTGELFGQEQNGQSRTNRNIIRLFNQAKVEISFPDACIANPYTHERLREVLTKIISLMTVPLIQSLIYNLERNDRDRVQIYAYSVVPLFAGCDPATFDFLNEQLIGMKYNAIDVDEIITRLQSGYSCLGLTCADVGVFKTGELPECTEVPSLNPLAGYKPARDVLDFAKLDLDIFQINILMKMKAYDAVLDYYMLGKNSKVATSSGEAPLTLYDLATTSDRSIVPSFDKFSNYFANQFTGVNTENYADYIIRLALDKEKLPLASDEQRREMTVKCLQYMVIFMASLQKMHEAIGDCESPDSFRTENSRLEWDRAAALMIGSLEGNTDGGTNTGFMMYALGKKRCEQFNRCAESGDAIVNEQLITLLYSGRSETATKNCVALRKTTDEIESLLQVPLIQGTLRYALANDGMGLYNPDGNLAEGYIFSRSILPYVHEANAKSAELIAKNMDFQFRTVPVPDGSVAVFEAFEDAIPNMNGVKCNLVGTVEGQNICAGGVSSGMMNHRVSGLLLGIPVILSLVLAFC